MRALCAFGKSSIKLGLLIISDHKNYCLKGEPHQGRNWEFFTDLLTNHSLPVFYLSFTAYLHLLHQNPLKNHL